MNRFTALLRGINVSGKKKIVMADLRKQFEVEGFNNVETYIQSGNLIFSSSLNSVEVIQQKIEKMILVRYNFEVRAIVKTHNELTKLIISNPFADKAENELDKLYTTFLFDKPTNENADRLNDIVVKNEFYRLVDNVIYLYVLGGYGKAKLNNNFLENKLEVTATNRNWKTINKLAELSSLQK